MQHNYSSLGDILLIDATYNTNKYSIPLIIMSRVDHRLKNVVFGIGLVNSEDAETYFWIISKLINLRTPGLVITDSDPSLISCIKKMELKDTIHRLCGWHISRNIARKFKSFEI